MKFIVDVILRREDGSRIPLSVSESRGILEGAINDSGAFSDIRILSEEEMAEPAPVVRGVDGELIAACYRCDGTQEI